MADAASVVTVLDACGRAGVPALLLSGPGMGKSSLIEALAAAQDVPCEVVVGSLREPSDFAGLPVINSDGVSLEAPAWAKRLKYAGKGVLFLDELTTSTPAVQAAMLMVTLKRRVGDLQLPSGIQVVAGANPPDQAAGGYELDPPLANRFCHIEFTPSKQEWIDGMITGWRAVPASRAGAVSADSIASAVASVTGFIETRPDLLDAYPRTAAAAGGAWPSRRTWDMLAKVLAHLRADDTAAITTAVFGLVGEGAGVEFVSWLAACDLPDPAAVVADPSIVDWGSERPDRVWAILSGVVALAAQNGSQDAFTRAWKPLAAAAGTCGVDVAAAAARTLAKARPAKAKIPAAARAFAPILRAAGLIDEAVA